MSALAIQRLSEQLCPERPIRAVLARSHAVPHPAIARCLRVFVEGFVNRFGFKPQIVRGRAGVEYIGIVCDT